MNDYFFVNKSYFWSVLNFTEHGLIEDDYVKIKDVEYLYEKFYISSSNKYLFEKYIKKLLFNQNLYSNKFGRSLLHEIANWIDELVKILPESNSITNKLILALLISYVENELIQNQPILKFNLCIDFFTKIREVLILKFEYAEMNDFIFLINSSLFYSYQQDLVRCDLKVGISYFQNGVNEASKINFLNILFAQFEPIDSMFFLALFEKTEVNKYKSFFRYLLEGKNIRKFNKNFKMLTKHEVELFKSTNEIEKPYIINSLNKLIIYIKLLFINVNEMNGLDAFLTNSFEFYENDELFLQKMEFWKDAYVLYLKHKEEDREALLMNDFVEYAEYQFICNKKTKLKKMTPESLFIAMEKYYLKTNDEWVYEDYLLDEDYYSTENYLDWKFNFIEDVYIEFENVLYFFSSILNTNQLRLEAKKMNHCVSSYAKECRNGETKIWSIKRHLKNKQEHYITFEIKDDTIIQAVKANNQNLNQFDMTLLQFWAKEYQIKISKDIPVDILPNIIKFDTSEFDFENDGIEIEF